MNLDLVESQFTQRKHFRTTGKNLIRLPKSLPAVTTIDRQREINSADVGIKHSDIEGIWRSIEDLYRTGAYPGISICMRRRGEIVMHRSIGHAKGNPPYADNRDLRRSVLMRPDTPVCYFSASKAVTAFLMHLLCEDGSISLHDPVSKYAPEFGQRGKSNISIYQVLAHRSGVPGLPPGTPIETLWDNDKIWGLLCAAQSSSDNGTKLAYHALTGGYILERVVQAVTGEGIQELLDKRLRQPMGMKYFRYGMADEHSHLVADNYPTGLKPMFPLSTLVKRALGGSLGQLEEVSNCAKFKRAVIPAGNMMGTAEEISRFFQMLLNGGEWQGTRICEPETVERLTQAYASFQFDRTLMIPMRYSAGLMLGGKPFGLWGADSSASFGHIGLMTKLCWADPKRDLSVSLLNTGVPLVPHILPPIVKMLNRINHSCR